VTLIKLGYPYFSKVQYGFSFQPVMVFYLLLHIVYDEFLTYWFHRLLHHPSIYHHLHQVHHRSKAVTPFTGFAFHPLDAFIQAVPVFTSCYFLPIPIDLVLAHGLVTSLWAISIHDNVNLFPFKGILYAGSHSIHHFPWGENYNYGKFTSICDRLYGTYCDPENITGYGYEVGKQTASITKTLNQWFCMLVPDNGIGVVSRIRELYAKKIKSG
jgi:Delta7-sterol 5-desaturase